MELKFEKETITKLDEQQMNEINGGSSYPCWKIAYGFATVVANVAGGGAHLSWWACDGGNGGNGGGAVVTDITCGGPSCDNCHP